MIHMLRPGPRVLAAVTAVAVSGLAPVLVLPSAYADGPVWSQSENRAPKKKKPRTTKPRQGHGNGQSQNAAVPAHKTGSKQAQSSIAKIELSTGGPSTPLIPGRTYTWPYTVSNSGPARAGSVTFAAPLPSGLEFVSAQGNCSWQGTQAVCQLGSLDQNQSVSGVVTAKVSAGALPGAPVNANATVHWDNGQTNGYFPGTSIGQASDLVVTKSGPGSARPGTVVPYEIKVVNRGPSAAKAVSLADTIQPISPRRAGSAVPLEIVKASAACKVHKVSLACNLGDMSAGATKVVSLSVKLGPKLKPGTVLNLPAEATTPSNDIDLSNNNAAVQTKVGSEAPAPAVAAASNLSQLPASNMAQLPATGSDTQTVLDLALAFLGIGLILLRLATMRRRRV